MKLGTKLVLSLLAVVIVIMTIHGYLSLQQDQESMDRELRVGMRGFTRVVAADLTEALVKHRDLKAVQRIIDTAAPRGNIHVVIVYDRSGKIIARSDSLRYANDFPELEPYRVASVAPATVLNGGEPFDGYIRDQRALIYYRVEPILYEDGETAAAFVIARQGYRLFANLDQRRDRILTTTTALIILLTLSILILVRRSVTRPINELISRIREIGRGEWEQRITTSRRDEVASLAHEFNLMCEQLEQSRAELISEQNEKLRLEKELRYSERLASIGRLAAGVAHEIGTPLNIIGGRAEFLQRRARSPEEIANNLQVIRSQTDRITAIVRQLLEFSRRREPAFQTVNVTSLLENVKYLLEHQIAAKSVRVEIRGNPGADEIPADPDLLQQVFLNLFSNSLQALPQNGTIFITVSVAENGRLSAPQSDKPMLLIRFEDNGCGIASEHLNRVFDPFFTTKDVGEGTGLGLAVSYGIIKDHGGEIYVESEAGRFTRFLIYLPVSRHSPAQSQPKNGQDHYNANAIS